MAGISSDVIRGCNDIMILYLLRDNPSYGYEISKQIKQMSDEKYIIKETTLYSAFSRMEKNGYVTSFQSSEENGKKRTYYQITDEGRSYYREKCQEWNLSKDVIDRFIYKGEE
ncbi:MAG: PadR family transcriptional regulator [Agathobacter sp.]|nr:PadR family transcriptional regulator [Agathobacter sp.]